MPKIVLEGGRYYVYEPANPDAFLGEGGMGSVFRGKLFSGTEGVKDVAIKILHASLGAEGIQRAQREASIQINHENILYMYGFVEVVEEESHELEYHVVSEYLDGTPLSLVLQRNGPFSPEEALRITRSVLTALSFLHDEGYVHRDIDPSNIMEYEKNNQKKIKIIDFGIAKKLVDFHSNACYSEANQREKSKEGVMLGKICYASPEQFNGQHELTDRRSDIYSAGILLFELLTGRLPYKDILEVAARKPVPKGLIPENLYPIVKKATHPSQKERYQTAIEFIDAIDKALKEIILHPEKKKTAPEAASVSRSKKWLAMAAATVAVALMGVGAKMYLDRQTGKRYDEMVVQAHEKRTLGMYGQSLQLYRDAGKIRYSESVDGAIQVLDLFTSALAAYRQSNYAEAYRKFEALAAGEQSSEALYYLGEMNYEGLGTPKDVKKGLAYTAKSAEMGNLPAAYRLGIIYHNGIPGSVRPDTVLASGYFKKAEEMLNRGAEAGVEELLYMRGNMYLKVKKDTRRAINDFEAAAQNDHPQAQYALFEMMAAAGSENAVEWLQQSARRDYPKAMYQLGKLKMEKRDTTGFGWLKKAAEKHNFSPALRDLGVLYYRGASDYRVHPQLQKSHEYSLRAYQYDGENLDAINDLVFNYHHGYGVGRNQDSAQKYRRMYDEIEKRIKNF